MSIAQKDFNKIKEAYEYYDLLIGEPLVYVYRTKKGNYKSLKVDFKRSNFMHLCGVKYLHKGKPNPNEFYNALGANSVNLNQIKTKKDGTTQQKLQVIADIKYLNTCNVSIVDNQITLLNSEFGKAVKRKNLLLLGLKHTQDYYVPASVFNIKRKNIKMEQCEVLAVFKKEISESALIDSKPIFEMKKTINL